MGSYKKHTSLFFLIFFISFKLLALHSLSHNSEHPDNCDICEYIITSNTTPFLASSTALYKEFIQNNYNKQPFYIYSHQFTQTKIDSNIFYRPPPTF